MKILTTIHVHYQKHSWETEGKFIVFYVQLDDTEDRTYVGPQEIEIEVPDSYDPRAQQVAALEALKQNPHLARGLNVLRGEITYPAVAEALDMPWSDPFGVWAKG